VTGVTGKQKLGSEKQQRIYNTTRVLSKTKI
jgi:hypothetical protein